MRSLPSIFGLITLLLLFSCGVKAQTASDYTISFENAVHHEAHIEVTFSGIKPGKVELRMSRSSPGRYALHEFAKNVYDVKVSDGAGKSLGVIRPDPYSWLVDGHDGTLNVSYTLFANHGDGTYAQVDETHAHLNIPATFMYAPQLADRQYRVTFKVRDDLGWKVATQMEHEKGNTYTAKDLQYFMDSPTEISDHSVRSFQLNGQTIKFVLHHNGSDAEFDSYFNDVKKVVGEQLAIYGTLPKFDFGEYTFLSCYLPNVSGDGMEHRNSTICTSTRSLAGTGALRNMGTVSHEFFHAWNVERFRPKSLEPFSFERANMSGELWFAEGFTTYYGNLTMCRAGLLEPNDYIKRLVGTFNYVWNSPAREIFNPIEMSYQAPFNDAAESVDERNARNTFISYYSYGHMLGLALDLALREKDLSLDGFMKKVWNTFGNIKTPYTNADLHNTLNDYAGKEFGDNFFNQYVYKSEMPDFKKLLATVGVDLSRSDSGVYFGAWINSKQKIGDYPHKGSPVYNAGLTKGDKILQIGEVVLNEDSKLSGVLSSFKAGDEVTIKFDRFGTKKEAQIKFTKNRDYVLSLFENKEVPLTDKVKKQREAWLASKQ